MRVERAPLAVDDLAGRECARRAVRRRNRRVQPMPSTGQGDGDRLLARPGAARSTGDASTAISAVAPGASTYKVWVPASAHHHPLQADGEWQVAAIGLARAA